MLYQDKTIVTRTTDMVFKNFNFEKSNFFFYFFIFSTTNFIHKKMDNGKKF